MGWLNCEYAQKPLGRWVMGWLNCEYAQKLMDEFDVW
jgi:hypothetical protein